jgi:predicted RNA-binding protein
MYDLLGEQKIVDAVIKEVKLLDHKVILENRKDKR